MKYILGKKLGMTTVIDEEGTAIPVTVIIAEPCVVTQIRTKEKEGYTAVQLGCGTIKKRNKAIAGHLAKSGKLVRTMREIRVEAADNKMPQTGDSVTVNVFEKGDKVKVTGAMKGKGFTGTVKRWGFRGGPGSHGHPASRKVGSIGSAYPQHVPKGRRMAGRKGPSTKTISGLSIFGVDTDRNALLIKGSVPGIAGGLLEIRSMGGARNQGNN